MIINLIDIFHCLKLFCFVIDPSIILSDKVFLLLISLFLYVFWINMISQEPQTKYF